jgi:Phage integrase, N-terminal SAM-like domain
VAGRYWDATDNRVGAPSTFATKGDAQRWLSAAETNMSRGEWHDPRLGGVPFREWAASWLVTKAPKLQASTVDLYRYLLRRYIVPRFGPRFGSMALGRIAAVEVQAWVADMRD